MSEPRGAAGVSAEGDHSALPNPFQNLPVPTINDAPEQHARSTPSLGADSEQTGRSAADDLRSQLDAKFPLRKHLLFREKDGARYESIPPVISLVAAMANPEIPGSNCLLVPVRDNVAALTAVLCALQSAVAHFPEQLQKYLETSFQRGERVRVLPEGYVYVFNGHMKHGDKQFFSLKFLDDTSNASRSFSIDKAVRLEKTNARSPKGSGQEWSPTRKSNLDILIGTSTEGNNALLANEVVLGATQKSFSEFLGNVYVSSSEHPELHFSLKDVIPWGTIDAEGNIEFRNSAAASGAPLIAVASRSEYIAAFCRRKEATASSVVIVDGADRIKDLQSLDDLTGSGSKLLIVADHSDLDLLPTISNRGVHIIRMPGATGDLVGNGFGILDRFQRAANCAEDFSIETTECVSSQIDEIADHIFRAEKELRENDADDAFLRFISIGYARLLDIASLVAEPDQESAQKAIDDLNAISADVLGRRTFMPVKAFYNLRSAFAKLCNCIDNSGATFFGEAKQTKLIELLDRFESACDSTVVICPSNMAIPSASRLLKSAQLSNARVSTLNSFLTGDKAERIILLGWPRSQNLQKLLNSYQAADIHILAYGFEATWFRNHLRRRERSISRWQPSRDALSSMTGLAVASLAAEPAEVRPDFGGAASEEITAFEAALPKIRKGSSASVPEFQESRPAKYVGFVGQSYCYLTANHEVPKVTDILRGTPCASGGVRSATVSDLVCGDRVLFRMSSDSDKDMIRLLAEAISPPGEYERRRNVAQRWKQVLNKLGDDAPGVVTALRKVGLHRTLQTVRQWISNPNLIGPAEIDDLVLIARAANDPDFANGISETWEAIQSTRGSHMTAGFKLSQLLIRELPKQMPALSDAETIVELTNEDVPFGRIAIVEVDDISEIFENRSYVEINRLLW
jgi:hypothetical protein